MDDLFWLGIIFFSMLKEEDLHGSISSESRDADPVCD